MSNSVEKLMSVLVAMGHWTGFGVSARYPGRVEIQLPKALIADPVMAGRSGGDFEGCTGEPVRGTTRGKGPSTMNRIPNIVIIAFAAAAFGAVGCASTMAPQVALTISKPPPPPPPPAK